MHDVSDRIRRARRVKGCSQAELAERLGVTTSAVGHWERPNGHQPSSENLIEIARHLSVNLEWLAVGRGEMHASDVSASKLAVAPLNADEEALVKHFQGLPPPSRALLRQFIEALAASNGTIVRHRVSRSGRAGVS